MGGPSDIPDVGPIYYEPFNRPEDIICGESEDEYCATPAARRRRIEAAARRFLNGEIPFIVSAQLLGPFTKESGWQNPWSHGKQLKRLSERRAGETNRTANTRKGPEEECAVDRSESESQPPHGQTPLWSPAKQDKANSHHTTAATANPPSPHTTQNPYMEDAVLARVQIWRDEVQAEGPSGNELEELVPEANNDSSLSQKRKIPAKLSKPEPTILKRRKTKETEMPSTDSRRPETNAVMRKGLSTIAATPANREDKSNTVTDTPNRSFSNGTSTTRMNELIPISTRRLRSTARKDVLASSVDVVVPTSTVRKAAKKTVVKKRVVKKPIVEQTRAHEPLTGTLQTTVHDHQEAHVTDGDSSSLTSLSLSDGFLDRSFERCEDASFHYCVARQGITEKTAHESPCSMECQQSPHETLITVAPSPDKQTPPDAVSRVDAVSAMVSTFQDDLDFAVNGSPESGPAELDHESPARPTLEIHQSPGLRTSQTEPQSPWGGAHAEIAQVATIEEETLDNTASIAMAAESMAGSNPDQAGLISASSSPFGVDVAHHQSPCRVETPTIPRSQKGGELRTLSPEDFKGLQNVANRALGMLQLQSPWKRDEGSPRLTRPTSFHALSPPDSVGRMQGDLGSVLPTGRGLGTVRGGGEGYRGSQPVPPSTPEPKQSSLPTPDFKLSNRSLRYFRTPSPRQSRQAKRVSLVGGQLPSTQALIDATVSNPWTGLSPKKTSKKRVSFGPLPGESGCEGTDSTVDHRGGEMSLARACSPPPQVLITDLPRGDNQTFAKHFAAASRRRSAMARNFRPERPLLPSESQRSCASPAVEAMAEAFLDADALQPARQKEEARAARRDEDHKEVLSDDHLADTYDPIHFVLDNLDDFLGPQWDIDAELQKARTGTALQGRGN